MKKLFAVLLIIVMCLSLAACGESRAIVGTWRMDVSAIGDEVPEGEHYAYVCFDGKGNYTYAVFAGSEQLSKTAGTYYVESDQLSMIIENREINFDFKVDGDEMTLSYGGNTQVLTKFTDEVIF